MTEHKTLLHSKLQEVKGSACLNLSGIRIKKDDLLLIEKCLRNYRSIKHIYMSGCHLNCCNLDSISCHFGSVVKLDLSDNLLQEIRNDIFNCMPNVQTLDISMNKLSKLSADICKLKNLAELNLANNQLLYLPEEIGSLRKLMLLDVSHNLLDEIPSNLISSEIQHNLKKLNCRGNILKCLPEELGLCTHLEELDIRDNNLTHLPLSVKSLTNLQVLHFSGNRWTVIGLQYSLTRQDEPLQSSYGPNALERLYSLTHQK